MRHTIYYLIEPNSVARREFSVRVEADAPELLLDSVLTSKDIGDRSRWRWEECELAVKLIFLARLREYEPFREDSDAARILGSSEVSVELFDRWWTIRKLDYEDRSESLASHMKAVIHRVKPTKNEVVDKWVAEIADAV